METTDQEQEKVHMATMIECINSLKIKGYHKEFKVTNKKLIDIESNQSFKANEVHIHNFYRFEGESDPGDMEILYALETADGTKGTLGYVYGPLTSEENQAASNFIKDVRGLHDDNPKRTEKDTDLVTASANKDVEPDKDKISG